MKHTEAGYPCRLYCDFDNVNAGHTDTYDNYWLGCVHVKDVARAQILLYETPSASGRHLCVSRMLPFSNFAEIQW